MLKKLSELNNLEALEAVQTYYNYPDLTVKEICELLDIKYNSNFIISIKLYSEDLCEVCGGRVKYILESREYPNSCINENKKICVECGHNFDFENCNCISCTNKRREIKKQKELTLKKMLEERSPKPIKISECNLIDLIFLDIAIKKNNSIKLGRVFEKDYFVNLTRNIEFNASIVNSMVDRRILRFDLDESEIEFFTFKEENSVSYNPSKICYEINIIELINREICDIVNFIKENFKTNEIEEFWYEIGTIECLDYLDIKTSDYNLEIIDIVRDDIKFLINDLLREFEIGKIFYMIDYSVRRASNFQVQYRVPIERVHKAILTNLRNSVDYIFKNSYERPFEMPETTLFEYFRYNILGIEKEEAFSFLFRNEIYLENMFLDEVLEENIEKNSEMGNKKNEFDVIREFEDLSYNVKSLVEKGIPEEFIIKSLKITKEIFDAALKYELIDLGEVNEE